MGFENPSQYPSQDNRPSSESGGDRGVTPEALESLNAGSLSIENLYLPGSGETIDAKTAAKPLTFNENAGNIVYADAEGRRHALPATNETREMLARNGFQQDPSVGVPWLNQEQVWGKGKEQNSSFQRWHALAEQARPIQEAELREQLAAQEKARKAEGGAK